MPFDLKIVLYTLIVASLGYVILRFLQGSKGQPKVRKRVEISRPSSSYHVRADQVSPDNLSEAFISELKDILQNEGKIYAIKVYRDVTGAGLRDSKNFIESLE